MATGSCGLGPPRSPGREMCSRKATEVATDSGAALESARVVSISLRRLYTSSRRLFSCVVATIDASSPRYGLRRSPASPGGPGGQRPRRVGVGLRRAASAIRARSPPPGRHQRATPDGRNPSPSAPCAPRLLWPPSRPALCGTPRDLRGCSVPFVLLSDLRYLSYRLLALVVLIPARHR